MRKQFYRTVDYVIEQIIYIKILLYELYHTDGKQLNVFYGKNNLNLNKDKTRNLFKRF